MKLYRHSFLAHFFSSINGFPVYTRPFCRGPFPFNDANSFSVSGSIRWTVPSWKRSVKDANSAAINVMVCHFGIVRCSE